ncbi:MAG: DUF362 domain-containing protein [Clostridia bacterium]|nr:DUF362 domain-containing protein [Clostridia bacterium]
MEANRTIYVVYGGDAREMTLALLSAANIKEEIPQGAKIALKPNLVVAKGPESGATTHRDVLAGCIEYLQAHGHMDICIMESAWVGESTKRSFQAAGFDALCARYGVPFMDLKQDQPRQVDTPIGKMAICRSALDADYLISLPVLKGHCQTGMTCALKNSKGCIPDSEKRRFHALGLAKPIAALGTVLRPHLTIVDSLCGDLDFEEGGTPVQTGRMFLGHDQVQMDAFGCRLMGISPRDVSYLPFAQAYGAGSMEIGPEDVVYLNQPSQAPSFPKPTGVVSRLTRHVEQRSACSACYGNLVHALYRLEQAHHKPCNFPICIGQGFKDTPIPGIGIGACCNCASIQAKGCPPSAETILRLLLEACR